MTANPAGRRRFRVPSGMNLVNLLLGGWTLLVLLFLYVPILVLLVSSFNDSVFNNAWEGATLRWYKGLYQSVVSDSAPAMTEGATPSVRRSAAYISGSVGEIVRTLKNSLMVAVISTVVATTLGTLSAWLLFRYQYPLSRALNTLIAVPMVVPEVIMGISLLIFFSTIEFNRGYLTVIFSHITFCFPFVMITVQARLVGLDPALEEAAMDLGATPLQAFWRVIVPYLLPAIISGALMAFTLSLDELIVTYFVGNAESQTFPWYMLGSVKRPNPMILAVSSLLVVATALLVILAELLKRPTAR